MPKKSMAAREEIPPNSSPTKIALGWVGVILLVYVVTVFAVSPTTEINKTNCPYQIKGNTNASLNLKYFGTPACIYCRMYEPVLDDLQKTRGEKFFIEYYDTRYCANDMREYDVSSTPTTAFVVADKPAHIARGYLDEIQLQQIFCSLIGVCQNE